MRKISFVQMPDKPMSQILIEARFQDTFYPEILIETDGFMIYNSSFLEKLQP